MGGFSSLGINLPLLVAFLINFAVLFILLKIFLYKPILKMLDERAKKTQEGMELAEATKKEYEQAKAEVQRQIEKGRQEGQTIVAQAVQAGERLRGITRRGGQAGSDDHRPNESRVSHGTGSTRRKVEERVRRYFDCTLRLKR